MSTPPATPQVSQAASVTAAASKGSLLQRSAVRRVALAAAVLAALWLMLLASLSAAD